jgi:hypothetical protein
MGEQVLEERTTYENAGTAPSSKAASMLSEELDTLNAALGRLEDRLAYVLTPVDEPGALLRQGGDDRVQVSPLAERLEAHALFTASLSTRVQQLLARLDLPA